AARLGLSAPQIGIVLSAALWSAAIAALVTLVFGPQLPERAILVTLCALPVAGGILLIAADAFTRGVGAAGVGSFNAHGPDRGPIPIVEQALFPATTSDTDRTRVFAWY